MSVKLLIDMNLSVEWIPELATHGWSAVHWSTIGDPRAEDSVIMAWALANRHVVFKQINPMN
jgi:predicted nuclease of predicted toxin-antitoxin system